MVYRNRVRLAPYTRIMADLSVRVRALRFVVIVALPVGFAVLLNALARPALATQLGGVRQQSFTNYRSFDGWWEFDASVAAEHPLLTGFLGLSDGAIAMLGLLGSGLVLGAILLRERFGSRAQR